MPITDAYARLPLTAIFVPREERQRRKLDTKDLIDSIRLHGVLQPIIVHRLPEVDGPGAGKHRLTAGERRYTSSLELGLPDIPVRFAEDLSPIEAAIFELEENIKRRDLEWSELVLATAKIHELYSKLDILWTQQDTAKALAVSEALLSMHLRVAKELGSDQLASAKGVKEAYNILARRDSREDAQMLEEILGIGSKLETEPLVEGIEVGDGTTVRLPPPTTANTALVNPSHSIIQESFIQWAPRYTGRPFNLIHCDFPYGIKVFDGPQSGRGRHLPYLDSSDVHSALLECLLTNLDRIASHSCHILYWFSMQHYQSILQAVADLAPSLTVHTHPLIWLKSDNTGISPDPRRTPRHIYETCLFMSRGDRQVVRVVSDAYAAPTDHNLHVHTKPEPMLRHFMTMLVDEYTSLLDPTCGSGSALRAAESLGAQRVFGMDIDENTVGSARQALRNSRLLRSTGQVI